LAAAAAARMTAKTAGMSDADAGWWRLLPFLRGNGGIGGIDTGILLPIDSR